MLFRSLATLTGIGVLNTFMAKGALPTDSEQSLYTIGLGSKDIGTYAIDAADLVICIGFDMVEYHPSLWNAAGDKKIIHIDFMPAEIDSDYHPELELVGDVADTIEALVLELKKTPSFDFDLSQQALTRKEMAAELDLYLNDVTKGLIKPQKALAATTWQAGLPLPFRASQALRRQAQQAWE